VVRLVEALTIGALIEGAKKLPVDTQLHNLLSSIPAPVQVSHTAHQGYITIFGNSHELEKSRAITMNWIDRDKSR
jgi:hypothetical protein